MDAFERVELRFGTVVRVFYDVSHEKYPRQLDLLNDWLPGMIVFEREGDKRDAEYLDDRWMIVASRVNGSLYAGNDPRVTQITGRLIGTAKGNAEKERRAAESIQKHLAEMFVKVPESVRLVKQTVAMKLDVLNNSQLTELGGNLMDYCMGLAFTRDTMDEMDKYEEAFPMDDEVYGDIVYNAAISCLWTIMRTWSTVIHG